ncbi:MAG: ATP phosphoribosyltransferase [Clostridiales bacterium]|nr:ATP phosphoribosyltransferase [Clostridiales bacterium]
MINVALPKGRLGNKVFDIFAKAGYDCQEMRESSRQLIFTSEKNNISYFLVKPSDVSIYVEHGAADIGIAGKDILLEYEPDVYELLDLNIGKCKMCVAGKTDFKDNPDVTLRVATKFVNIANTYYKNLNREIEIIKLNGSIELAPILNLSDVIVDIVETGTTLKENNLGVLTEILPISARLIANKASYKFKTDEINTIVERFREELQND